MPQTLKRASAQRALDVTPYSPALGAEVRGVNLANGLDLRTYREIRAALLEHQVLFFKEQTEIPPQTQIEIGRMFGELHMHPAAPHMHGYPEIFEIYVGEDSKVANGEFWHSDVSCDEVPPLGTILQLHILPEIGGDTLFANMYAAYDALSEPMRKMLSGLSALHESEHVYRERYSDRGVDDTARRYPEATHPVVRTHPETGRKALYVNRTFTTRINELQEAESNAVLEFLFDHCEGVDFQIRYRWERNEVAFWDNRCAMHRAIWDYWPEQRKGRRVTIKGDRPT
ncbi:TauD/TfdA dioxygenase family protein [Candidatus Rariloculus sp.]|uniref:TauD/TfdA dioxygenase family protein n=1 Tax=Candidatus Rariloculus sp. TaxID=3101265 RepID=UPI003D11B556